MSKVFIPMELKHRAPPHVYEFLMICNDQRTVDAMCRIYLRRGAVKEVEQIPEHQKSARGDIQAASSYSLGMCQGGGKYHQVEPKKRVSLVDRPPANKLASIKMTVVVPEHEDEPTIV